MSQGFRVGVVGATGAVGREFLQLFEDRNLPISELRLMASARSAGKQQEFKGEKHTLVEATPEAFEGLDFAFFSAGSGTSKALAPEAAKRGVVVIDNSSAFRMDLEIPLVVPEINIDAVQAHHKIIANPNCVAIILLMAVAPLRKLGKIERIIVSTYQSASGAGAAAMQELEDQTRAVLAGGKAEPVIMPHPYAFNLFSHNTKVNEHGYNEEEWKVIQESRKILGMPELKLNVTCIRVPILRAHSESITVEFDGPAPSEAEVREVMAASEGVRVVDDREGNYFPMPSDASGGDDVLVGRIRQDVSNPNAICLFAAGDQLLKGAALNAVQIAEKLMARAN